MEIKRVGENKIRCALTEDEIREMGFDIDEIIGNGEATQKFMRVVLKIVEEQENISLEQHGNHIWRRFRSEFSAADGCDFGSGWADDTGENAGV